MSRNIPGGFIDPWKPIEFLVKCYECGKAVNQDNPIKGHEECPKNRQYKLKVKLIRFNFVQSQSKKSR